MACGEVANNLNDRGLQTGVTKPFDAPRVGLICRKHHVEILSQSLRKRARPSRRRYLGDCESRT